MAEQEELADEDDEAWRQAAELPPGSGPARLQPLAEDEAQSRRAEERYAAQRAARLLWDRVLRAMWGIS